MISVSDAQQLITQACATVDESQTVSLSNALGRVIATDIIAPFSLPGNDLSAMDGYALNTQSLTRESDNISISQRIQAGAIASPLEPGTAARIFTGAPIPFGANAVIIQENVSLTESGQLQLNSETQSGDNIRRKGSDILEGEKILPKGTRLEAQHIGLLAGLGFAQVDVFRKVRVSILNTGDELLEPGSPLQAGKIYNSNKALLFAMLSEMHCDIVNAVTVKDNLTETTNTLKSLAEKSDLIISTGGASVGEEDHIKPALEAIGELNLWKVRLKPGKPLLFGKIDRCHLLGLPGNPGSAFVTFHLFANPYIRKCQGDNNILPIPIKMASNFSARGNQSRPEYIRVRISASGVDKFPNQSSGGLASLAFCNALALIPMNAEINQDDLIDVFVLNTL